MSINHLEDLFIKYKNKGVLIDTNILLVYFIGTYKPSYIEEFKRTKTFALEDFYTLTKIFDFFQKVITTSNILTEVYNLSNHLPQLFKNEYFDVFKKQVDVIDEHYIPSREICSFDYFNKVGLTDSAIIALSNHEYLVLIDDFKLSNYLQTHNIDVVNFNHIRYYFWK